jgi:hypothetical protein
MSNITLISPQLWKLQVETVHAFQYNEGRDSVVSITTRYRLDGHGIETRWGARFSAPVHTDRGDHPASCTTAIASLSAGKAARAWRRPPRLATRIKVG